MTDEARAAFHKCVGQPSSPETTGTHAFSCGMAWAVVDLQDLSINQGLAPEFGISYLDTCHSLVFIRDLLVESVARSIPV